MCSSDLYAGGQVTLTNQANKVGSNLINSAIVIATTPDPNLDDDSRSTNITVWAVNPPGVSGAVVNNNGTFQFTVGGGNGQPGWEYIVQASTNLFDWVSVHTNYTSSFTYTDSGASNYLDRFYRVRVIPGP